MLSAEFLKSRGECCGLGCKNCPYVPKHTQGSTQIRSLIGLGSSYVDTWIPIKSLVRTPFDCILNRTFTSINKTDITIYNATAGRWPEYEQSLAALVDMKMRQYKFKL